MAKEPEAVEDLPAPKDNAAGAAGAPPASGGSKMGLIIPVVTVLMIPLVMILTWEFYMMPSLKKLAKAQPPAAAQTEENAAAPAEQAAPAKEEAKDKGKGKEGEAVAGTYEFKDIVANLSGAMRSRYIKVTFTLSGKAKNFTELMKGNEPMIRDASLAVLSDLTIQDMEEPGVKNIVRNKIIASINTALHTDAVEELYFSEFVVQ